jgi:hypothetical protein
VSTEIPPTLCNITATTIPHFFPIMFTISSHLRLCIYSGLFIHAYLTELCNNFWSSLHGFLNVPVTTHQTVPIKRLFLQAILCYVNWAWRTSWWWDPHSVVGLFLFTPSAPSWWVRLFPPFQAKWLLYAPRYMTLRYFNFADSVFMFSWLSQQTVTISRDSFDR